MVSFLFGLYLCFGPSCFCFLLCCWSLLAAASGRMDGRIPSHHWTGVPHFSYCSGYHSYSHYGSTTTTSTIITGCIYSFSKTSLMAFFSMVRRRTASHRWTNLDIHCCMGKLTHLCIHHHYNYISTAVATNATTYHRHRPLHWILSVIYVLSMRDGGEISCTYRDTCWDEFFLSASPFFFLCTTWPGTIDRRTARDIIWTMNEWR